MSLERMMIHKCDIYHLQKEEIPKGYNQPPDIKYSYKGAADVTEAQCFFPSNAPASFQNTPQQTTDEQLRVLFLSTAPLKHNDKVIRADNGVSYYIRNPVKVANPTTGIVSHIKAIAERKKEPWLTQ